MFGRNRRKRSAQLKRRNRASLFRRKVVTEKKLKPKRAGQGGLQKLIGRPNTSLILLLFLMFMGGLLMIFSASAYYGYTRFDDPFYFVTRQLLLIIFGTILGFILYLVPLSFLKKSSPVLLAFGILMLIYILPEALFGNTYIDAETGETITSGIQMPLVEALNGATRWINLQFFHLQPSEYVKFAFLLYIAAWLAKERKSDKKDKLERHLIDVVIPFLILLAIISGMILLQRDFDTTAVIVLSVLIVYFVSGTERMHTLGSLLILFSSVIFGILALIIEPYRRERLNTFFHIFAHGQPAPGDAQAGGFQVFNGLVGLGSGGIFGNGFGESVIKQGYLQEAAYTDSIFAVIGDEFGFLGSITIIIGFLYFSALGLEIAKKAPDTFSALLAVGMTSAVALQAFLNIAAVLALIPFGGMPLPFFTYGGSNTIITLVCCAVLLNISKNNPAEQKTDRAPT